MSNMSAVYMIECYIWDEHCQLEKKMENLSKEGWLYKSFPWYKLEKKSEMI